MLSKLDANLMRIQPRPEFSQRQIVLSAPCLTSVADKKIIGAHCGKFPS